MAMASRRHRSSRYILLPPHPSPSVASRRRRSSREPHVATSTASHALRRLRCTLTPTTSLSSCRIQIVGAAGRLCRPGEDCFGRRARPHLWSMGNRVEIPHGEDSPKQAGNHASTFLGPRSPCFNNVRRNTRHFLPPNRHPVPSISIIKLAPPGSRVDRIKE